ncbi:MAG: enoyl-CoA hydratase [Actinomycetota bacterium]|nr:enoyl-CoA hydratase [Actinomycetota bacterium]
METLELERKDGIVTITLDRPEKKNAINGAMWTDLLAAFTEVADNDDDRVLVLTGRGDGFCSGADLSGGGRDETHPVERLRHIADVVLRLHRLSKPTIAKVNGVAAGAGCNLALCCDLVIASDSARFSEIFARRGLSLDCGGSWLLPRIVGMQKAKELALLAEIISAQEALDIGLVNRVVPHDELDAVVAGMAEKIAAGPPLALSMSKTMLNNAFMVSMDQALEDEARCQAVNLVTDDVKEAFSAFLEKRDPVFRSGAADHRAPAAGRPARRLRSSSRGPTTTTWR